MLPNAQIHTLLFLIIAGISLKLRLVLNESEIEHTSISCLHCCLIQDKDSECYQDKSSTHCSHLCPVLISVLPQMFEKHHFFRWELWSLVTLRYSLSFEVSRTQADALPSASATNSIKPLIDALVNANSSFIPMWGK